MQELLAIDIKSQLYFSEEDRESKELEDLLEETAVFRLRKKDGSEIWVEDHGRHVLDQEGNIIDHEGVLRDVTRRVLIESEIRKLNESLEERVAERTKQPETINKELAFHLQEIEQLSHGVKSNASITVHELPMIFGYATELRLLFQNLIDNGIKFQKKGLPPEIIISAENIGKEWVFSVKDNGIGIDKKGQEKIFIFFKRMHNRDEYKGSGIGLSHCKKIAEVHGGKLWVESTKNEGATFKFSIPV
ncbi:MAG: ATP-binding protein [Bacteroidales bacterium]|nr:ATP-binding protein [Bacteroidales bacterium]